MVTPGDQDSPAGRMEVAPRDQSSLSCNGPRLPVRGLTRGSRPEVLQIIKGSLVELDDPVILNQVEGQPLLRVD